MQDPGRTLLYADETIESQLVDFLLWSGASVEAAAQLGLLCRSPRRHLDEARKRGRVLLTRDELFHDAVFPFGELQRTGVVYVATEGDDPDFGAILYSLITTIGAAGTRELTGQKIELHGSRLIHHVGPGAGAAIDVLTTTWITSPGRAAQT